MSFLFPSLLWIGLPLVGVPLLIHLINLRRQQRVRWAAMQFLLESQKRNRRWILLKQWLLLLTRMAAIALLVLMLSHLVMRNEWLRLLGSGTTHHLVLVDDSYSMTDRWDNTTALDEAKRAVQAIVDQAHAQSNRQLVTLMRFSEAVKLSAGRQPQVFSQPINDEFRSQLEAMLASWDASETDVGPAQSLKAIPRLALSDDDQSLIVYLVSDFRARQFVEASEIRKLLEDLDEEADQVHLVRCVNEARPNLAITQLQPESGVRAAGVEMWMNLTVANYSDEAARDVIVELEQDGDALPAIVLEEIPPWEEISHRFLLKFTGTGSHSLVASLAPDAVEVDNRRYFACDLPAALPVLIIDGSNDGLGGRQLSLALAPGGTTPTGWQPRIEPASFLRDPQALEEQAAVFLLDVMRLGEDEISALEQYVEKGGGVAFFVGPECDRAFYNDRLYRDGNGLFPAPLKLPTQLLDLSGETAPDIEVSEHPLFRVLAGQRNSLLPLVLVNYYYALVDDWSPDEDPTLRVAATLRNGAPLTLDKRFGEGRVVTQLTRLSSGNTRLGQWSNWSLNPVFPVLANELASYLSGGRRDDQAHYVGDDLTVSVDEGLYESSFRVFLPSQGATRGELVVNATSANGRVSATLPEVATSGVYDVQLQSLAGPIEQREFAFNVSEGEGDLTVIDNSELAAQLDGLDYQIHSAADMTTSDQQLAGFQLGPVLLALLVAILLLEQLLAYGASYHIAPLPARGHQR